MPDRDRHATREATRSAAAPAAPATSATAGPATGAAGGPATGAAGAAGFPTGVDLLHDPLLNKDTAFTERERLAFGLRGLLPPRVDTMEEQVRRAMENYRAKPNDLEKYIYLTALYDRNETLFYRLLMDDIEEMMPIVYTPTVGNACQRYGRILRRSRGLYVSVLDRGHVRDILQNWPQRSVRVIVVTDGERILGLGDLGANGMGIPVGKLTLYTACAGIDPATTLPVTLDVGSNNEELLADPLYLGIHQQRRRGEEYDELVDEFVAAVQERFPGVLLQFEDFANRNAFRLLARYRERICTFNDDIQGTAAMTLAGIYSALRITGAPLAEQRFLFLGAGGAGVGIADLLAAAMAHEGPGEDEARQRCWLVDSHGLVVKSRQDLREHKLRFAHDLPPQPDFAAALAAMKPTAIIGVAGQKGAFTREVVEAMAALNERPIVFALSNPTSKAECTAEQAYTWSEGRAIFAGGSPFAPVRLAGKILVPGQGNNAYIFPGLGLAVVATGARRVTNEMFFAAAQALAAQVTDADLANSCVYPPLSQIRDVSAAIATAVARVAYAQKLAAVPEPEDLPAYLRSEMYRPEYRSYV